MAGGGGVDARDFSLVRLVVRPLLDLLAYLGELALQVRDQLVAIGERRLRLRLDCSDLGRRGVGDTAGAARDLKRFNELRNQPSGR